MSETALEVIINGIRYIPDPAQVSAGRWDNAIADLEPDKPNGAWGKGKGGRAASELDARINLRRKTPTGYWGRIRQAAQEHDIPQSLLMAICCRESNHGGALDRNGEGDRGHAFGVGQVDKRYHKQRGRPDPYSLDHLRQCAEILADYREQVRKKHMDWRDKYVIKGAAVAYNSGVKNVVTITNMDAGTTGNDYGADVLARAQYYAKRLSG